MIDYAPWAAAGRSTRGAEHARDDRPNQDALAFAQAPCAFVAVADGHGSPRYTRSERGAAIAVEVARAVMPAFAGDDRAVERVRVEIAEAMVGFWRARVAAHLEDQPLEDAEAGAIGGPAEYAYGSTLVAVTALDRMMLAVQIGDGDVFLADATGVRRLIPRDLRFAFNVTASLCLEDAIDHVRIASVCVRGPALALVATDGYAKPLRSERELLDRVAASYERVLRDGLEPLVDALPADIAGASARGGDDVSVGMLYRA